MPQQEFVPSVPIAGTSGKLASGIVYKIKSFNGAVLDDWDGVTGKGTGTLVHDDAGTTTNRSWQIVPTENSVYCRIRSAANTVLDDWGGTTGYGTASFVADDLGPTENRTWKLSPANEPYFRIVSTHGVAIDDWGGSYTGKKTGASQATDDDNLQKNRSWHFIPSYNLKAEISDFEYLGDVKEILESHKKVELIDQHIAQVDQYTVGSKISRTFTKIITDTYTWGLNQKIGTSVSIEATAGVPLVGNVTTTVTSSAELGSSQEWSTSESHEVSALAEMTPNEPGTYKMSGWVDIADNVLFDFKAKALITATGTKWRKDGSIGEGAAMDGPAIDTFLRQSQDYENLKIEQVNASSVLATVTGKMSGTYGMSTYTKFQKTG